ncbi:MAG: Crp/Fnr family transcriptional regulator [Rhodothermales bacterium]|jgi:CRP-like cAMP-binding protein
MLPEPFNDLTHSDFQTSELRSGEYLFRMNDNTHSIFLIGTGEIHLQRYSEGGDLITIHRAFSGQFFAEAALFSETYHCDAVAAKNSMIERIKKSAILQKMKESTDFSFEVTAYFARQVQDYRRLLELRSIKSAKQRVLAGLLEGWHRGSIISFAAQLGLTHEATYRALNELVHDGRAEKIGHGDYRLSQ